MTIGRAQIEEQIKGFNAGGASVADDMTGNMTDEQLLQSLQMLQQAMNPQSGISMTSLAGAEAEQERIERLRKKDEEFSYGMERYKKQLAPLLSTSTRPNFFDLASDLGAAMLSAPADAGAFRSMGTGFAAFNERLKSHEKEKRQVDQQVALKAFELAKTDEKEANDYLNEYNLKRLEIANKTPNYETYEYDYTDPATGAVSRRTITLDENNPADMALIKGSTDAKGLTTAPELPNAVQVKKPDVALNMGSSSALSDKQGESLAKALEKMATDAETGFYQANMLQELDVVLNNLGPENVGFVEGKTLGARKLLSELGLKSDESISDQELLNTLGTRIAMQLIGDTKGAITEMEMRLFIAASPGLTSSYEGLMKQASYLKRIAYLNQKLFADFNADTQLAETMEAAQSDSQRARIYNNWLVNWRQSPENQFLSKGQLGELNRFAAEENDVAMSYRMAHPSRLGRFEGIDATGQGY
jgi:hypothetical protein